MVNKEENHNVCDSDEIVISGISGRFPNSTNIDEFEYNLYNKINMVNDDETRFKHKNPEIPKFSGKIPNISKFDYSFFGIQLKEANELDPQVRMLMEEAFKAVMDAGVNPSAICGTKTGVYIGTSMSETESEIYQGYGDFPYRITGCRRAMFANRISYALGLNGPSLICDTACSSSMYALDLAVKAMERKDIDAAIVGGANLCLHPNITLQFARLGIISLTGNCRPFDANANGYVRSETVSCIYLQRKYQAKRIYATVVCSKINCDGFKPEGITYPSSVVQEKLLKEIYQKNYIDLDNLGYLEAHCTSTIVGDPEECKAIDNAICKQRSETLLVGSVKSNCGHAEPAAGMCSLAKALLTLYNGIIPPNINFDAYKESILALKMKRMKVVTSSTKLCKPYVAVNSFGFGGANAHAVLKQFHKQKVTEIQMEYTKYRLITWSGRTESGVTSFLLDLESRLFDEEYLALAHSSQLGGINGMNCRSFAILGNINSKSNPTILKKEIHHWTGTKSPIVWVFSGMGSQWLTMGKSMLEIPLFKKSIQNSAKVLKALGLNLFDIISSDNVNTFENIIHSYVGIVSIQIAFVDILTALGVVPDLIVGHSAGELACSYADGCFTAEQTILAAYFCGKVSTETKKIKGAMVAIGLGYKDISPILPSSIDIACHNSSDLCTIAGPYEDVQNFITNVKSKGIFAKMVPSSYIAYHSKYVSHFKSQLLNYLKIIIPTPKIRSQKWLSTSVPRSQWLQNSGIYSSAEYHCNNMVSVVLFEEILNLIPENALVIEISPHCLLQRILKSRLTNGYYVGLSNNLAEDNFLHFLNAVGSIYNIGVEVSLQNLYPYTVFPVSRQTRKLSSIIHFDHNEDLFVFRDKTSELTDGRKSFSIKLQNHYQYLAGHEIDGRILVPATFYLECVWQTLASMKGVDYKNFPIEFENVKFQRATPLSANDVCELNVLIHRGSGEFEVTESNSLIVFGTARILNRSNAPHKITVENNKLGVSIDKKAFYKELKLRGYDYNGEFQSVASAVIDGSFAKINWNQNWVTFMDCMLQLGILPHDTRSIMLPTQLRFLRINPQHHLSIFGENCLADVYSNTKRNRVVSGGIEIIGLEASPVQRKPILASPVLENYKFIPNFYTKELCLDDIGKCCCQIALENQYRNNLNITEVQSKGYKTSFIESIKNAVDDLPLINGHYTIIKTFTAENDTESGVREVNQMLIDDDLSSIKSNITIINAFNEHEAENIKLVVEDIMEKSDFLIFKGNNFALMESTLSKFAIIASFQSKTENFIMLHKKDDDINIKENSTLNILQIDSMDLKFKWVSELQKLCKNDSNVLIVSQNEKFSGILGLVNCLRKEPDTKNVRCVFICDKDAPLFDINLPLFRDQIKLGLPINVYKNHEWGTYRHLTLFEERSDISHSKHIFGNISRIGDLSSLKWFDGPLKENQKDILITYASLNFKDVMQASGRLPITDSNKSRLNQICIFGFEYSGINKSNGKRVMGMTQQGAVSSYLHQPPPLLWEVPQTWSLRDAATVPVVYLTVYYAFFYTADIRKGKTILIHAGSGGVGLAAIRVALAYGLQVFTTVSTKEKKSFLLQTFPALNENHIGNSRDTSFEDMIKYETKEEGVDFVLNSLSEDKLKASLRCLRRRGHFMEIGKFDMANNNKLNLGAFINEISFHAIFADNLLKADKTFVETIKQHISEDITRGIIQPLPSKAYQAHEMEHAFRYLMSGKHIGKVLIQIRKDENSEYTLPISVATLTYFSPNLIFVIPGGLGGFGLELVDWMILRGARMFMLNSRRGISNDYQKLRLAIWESYSCKIIVNTSNIATPEGSLNILKEASEIAPIGGIFNLAVVLKDGLFANQNTETFQHSLDPKAFATAYLDELSRTMCPHLEHFVVFSSVSCGRGNAGQTNYGMANSIMECIIEDRIANGFPGKAIQWGAIGEVGLLANDINSKSDTSYGGTLRQRINSCLEVLDKLFSTNDAIVASMIVAEKKASSSQQTPIDFILNIMSIKDIKKISMRSTLSELGMDSLMSVEIKQAFERDYDIILNTEDLRSLTLAKLMELSQNVKSSNKIVDEKADFDFIEHLRQFYGQVNTTVDKDIILDHVNNISLGNPIIIFPGIDGCSGDIWKKIACNVNFPTYVLQYHKMDGANNISEMVEYALLYIQQLIKSSNTKNLQFIAYSMGTVLAHSITSALEKIGYCIKLILIDGSPFWLQNIIISLQKVYPGNGIDNITMAIILNVLAPELDLKLVQSETCNIYSKEELFKYAFQKLQKCNFRNIETAMYHIEAIYQRLKIIQRLDTYENISIVDAEYLLIKPSITTLKEFDEFYGLRPFTRNNICLRTLEGNHQTILENEELCEIFNNYFKMAI